MNIDVNKNGTQTTIILSGRLDTTTAPALDKVINEDIEGTTDLVLDFNAVEYVSSAGLRVLLAAQKSMQKVGNMKLIGVCDDVMEVFEMTGFSEILTIE